MGIELERQSPEKEICYLAFLQTGLMTDATYVPGVRKNLVFGDRLNKVELQQVIESDRVVITKKEWFVGKAYSIEGMFRLSLVNYKTIVNEVSSSSYNSFGLWHGKLSHVNY